MKNGKKKTSPYDIYRKIRNDWGTINPITKIIPNKKKNQKIKHKKGASYYENS